MFQKTMFKRYCLIFSFFIILLVGCSKPYEYTADGPFVTASKSPAGPDDFRNLISTHVAIHEDGTLILSEDENNQTDQPTLEAQLNTEDIKQLKEIIEEEKFRKLGEDISSSAEDGERYHVTVNFADDSKKVKGWNPDNEQFNTIHEHIFSLIDNDDYAKWKTEIGEYTWEHYSLDRNKKDEYKEDGPFFTLMMENQISNDNDHYEYYMEISLDLDGNLLLFAKDSESEKMTEVQTLEKKLADKDLAHFQNIILENFWKLNVNQRNSDHRLMETMTVYMTEEEKRIEGEEPDHPRYVKIKESIIDLIGQDEYEKWQSNVEEYLIED